MTDKPRHAGAPEDGIEVTREMIDAGCLELSMRNSDFEDDAEVVFRIYKAMFLRRIRR